MKEIKNKAYHVEQYALADITDLFKMLNVTADGMDEKQVKLSRMQHGNNEFSVLRKNSFKHCLKRALINPFSVILMMLIAVTIITSYLLPAEHTYERLSLPIVCFLFCLSTIVRSVQELKTKKIVDTLSGLINTEVKVYRNNAWHQITPGELVVGDIVEFEPGDFVPADIRLIRTEDFFISQSLITGESDIFNKTAEAVKAENGNFRDYNNIVFMGSSVSGGSAEGVVIAVGLDTCYGELSAERINSKRSFENGSKSITLVLLKFILVLIPVVFLLVGVFKGKWIESFIFATSVAVGLIPELLPMVINACLAKGSFQMCSRQTVVKNINAMQGFASMDILCIDKTGTLTGDKIELEYYMDILGNESTKVLDYAYLNSFYHSGIENHIDKAILKYKNFPGKKQYFSDLVLQNIKIDEQPFDYNKKLAYVMVQENNLKKVIVKGSVDEVIELCSSAEYKGEILKIQGSFKEHVHSITDELYECGIKVVAVAYKNTSDNHIKVNDKDFILLGYLGFFDAPKKSAEKVIRKLQELNIDIRILTGDNVKTTLSVCKRLGIESNEVITGRDLAGMNKDELSIKIEQSKIFAELTPKQKAQIVKILKTNGHVVGFLGDGINDLAASAEADIGVSVETGADAAKDIADAILLKKDLSVLEQGILIGRKSFANMIKYIKITASSNFGNIFSVVIASIFLPFLPMLSIQFLLLNLLYDILCLSLPWDNVDQTLLKRPLAWDGKHLSRFMLSFGCLSSLFDIITFLFLYFILCPEVCGGEFLALSADKQLLFIALFQTGWFLESLWTQVLILHLLRTPKVSFVKSRPSAVFLVTTVLGLSIFTGLAMTDYGKLIGMVPMPGEFYFFLSIIIVLYLLCVTVGKVIYCRKYSELI